MRARAVNTARAAPDPPRHLAKDDMRTAATRHLPAMMLVGALLLSVLGVLAASTSEAAVRPAFALRVDRTSVQLAGGAQAAVRVAVVSRQSWRGGVTLSVTGLPAH